MYSPVNKTLKTITCGIWCCILFLSVGYASQLLFHETSGWNAFVHANRSTAYRINEGNCCDAGVVTNRALNSDELFEVQIDRLMDGRSSINIGATAAPAESQTFPQFMYQMEAWNCILWSTFVVLNGRTINDNYGPDLLDLQVGARVGVMKKSSNLHMFINGTDYGPACRNVPSELYGVVDIISKTVQVSITRGDRERSPTKHSPVKNSYPRRNSRCG